MGGPKTKTTQQTTQANTFDFKTPTDTPDIGKLRDYQFTSDPAQPYAYAQANENLDKSYDNPYGAYTTQAVRDAGKRTGHMNLTQQQGQASAEENARLGNMRYAQLAGVADLTRPQLVQTGGTSSGTGTTQQSGGLLQSIIGGTAAAGSAALGNPALM